MKKISASSQFDQQQNSRAIDALRGYAILLVIGTHIISNMPGLVWPFKRLLLLGTSGVQLFFIASAVTLLMSWNREHSHNLKSKTRKFLINRFFRIVPLYFLSIVFYWFFNRLSLADFSLETLCATLFFYNAWSPYLLPTVGGWYPVPGGWSISVEFTFYLLFPLLALIVTTVRRALIFAVISYVVMLTANEYGQSLYPEITSPAREHFLFFWPPNQLVVFAIGFVVYESIKSETIRGLINCSKLSANSATFILVAVMLVVQFYDRNVWPNVIFMPPMHVLLSIMFAGWTLFMVVKPTSFAAPAFVVSVGKVSFSIYLVHFAILRAINTLLSEAWPAGMNGALSIPYAVILFTSATILSFLVARITYRYIEVPFVNFGKSLSGGGHLLSPISAA